MSQPLDFLAIGDIVTEPFIRLKEAEVHCEKGAQECQLCMAFGEKIPYESATLVAAVGNASNAAVSAARLGLSSGLKNEKVSTEYMVTQQGKASNYHYVLWYQTERTILIKHELYDYEVPTLSAAPKWVYCSSLADNSIPYYHALMELFAQHPDTKVAFQPGTFQIKTDAKEFADVYARSDIFFCNKEEAEHILKFSNVPPIKDLLVGMRALGPKIVVITDGTNGAYAFDGTTFWKIPMYPDARQPFERTGAGDAFASTVVAALALGKPLEEALMWGPINSMSVVQDVGAQKGLLTRDQIEKYLADAPDTYVLEVI
jgi:sugar/nucleoside kinase (ribokinase family)